MTWYARLTFSCGEKWCAFEAEGELPDLMRKAVQKATETIGDEPKLIRMTATRLKTDG